MSTLPLSYRRVHVLNLQKSRALWRCLRSFRSSWRLLSQTPIIRDHAISCTVRWLLAVFPASARARHFRTTSLSLPVETQPALRHFEDGALFQSRSLSPLFPALPMKHSISSINVQFRGNNTHGNCVEFCVSLGRAFRKASKLRSQLWFTRHWRT